MRHVLAFLLLPIILSAASLARAASPEISQQGAVVLGNAEIAAALAAYRSGGRTAHAVAAADEFRYWAVVRTHPGSVEVHQDWVDVTVIRAGRGQLRTGRRVVGDWEIKPGEWRGGHIIDPRSQAIVPGDIFVVPTGVAHQIVPTGAAPLEYVTIKVPGVAPDRTAPTK